eukprot:TRINITY_DN26251_c0_g1_i1.p1 TRINITY_DN26251_c0_g1~~TRINITY_DN26251_c0_g1_i1.p1  ORF type:complete len:447 (+),score=144.77 TRINITY_DN26251_c0_g1_i1:45-1343(+)
MSAATLTFCAAAGCGFGIAQACICAYCSRRQAARGGEEEEGVHDRMFREMVTDPRSHFQARCVVAALIQAGVPDAVAEDGLGNSVRDVASRCSVDAGVLSRLLRFAASCGIFEELPADGEGTVTLDGEVVLNPAAAVPVERIVSDARAVRRGGGGGEQLLESVRPQRRFRHTAISYALRSGVSPEFRSEFITEGAPEFLLPYTEVSAALRGTRSEKRTFFDRLADSPGCVDAFSTRLAGLAGPQTEALVAELRLPEGSVVADVGGGSGELLAAVLACRPGTKGVLVELSSTAHTPAVQQHLAADLRDGRAKVVCADFLLPLDAALGGCTAALLRWVLHDWADDVAVGILQRLHAVATMDYVAVLEHVVPSGPVTAPDPVYNQDVHMHLINSGRERTEAEWVALSALAGWKADVRPPPPGCTFSIIELRRDGA